MEVCGTALWVRKWTGAMEQKKPQTVVACGSSESDQLIASLKKPGVSRHTTNTRAEISAGRASVVGRWHHGDSYHVRAPFFGFLAKYPVRITYLALGCQPPLNLFKVGRDLGHNQVS